MRTLLATALVLLGTTVSAYTTGNAKAACDVKGAMLEESIAGKSELRESANKQAVRDLRTLRDAAIILETYKYETECERLVTIIKTLSANPEKAIEQSGDTDEEKAEDLMEARQPKATAPEKTPAAETTAPKPK